MSLLASHSSVWLPPPSSSPIRVMLLFSKKNGSACTFFFFFLLLLLYHFLRHRIKPTKLVTVSRIFSSLSLFSCHSLKQKEKQSRICFAIKTKQGRDTFSPLATHTYKFNLSTSRFSSSSHHDRWLHTMHSRFRTDRPSSALIRHARSVSQQICAESNSGCIQWRQRLHRYLTSIFSSPKETLLGSGDEASAARSLHS